MIGLWQAHARTRSQAAFWRQTDTQTTILKRKVHDLVRGRFAARERAIEIALLKRGISYEAVKEAIEEARAEWEAGEA